MSGNPNITVNVSIFIFSLFMYFVFPKVLDPPIAQNHAAAFISEIRFPQFLLSLLIEKKRAAGCKITRLSV